ncbi:tyrosine-type recombinase/integrase [Gracilibacillus lacisalsi]|uniref:tyrosine-type recombinase/integrase n=1 Tax=Gracilibacillus lacisalsi TaxID=393087 RepID=UPI0003682CB3|nr:tyrosine-type recombinase/integrase [Gracilibacillus lacisalsi]
MARRSNNLSTVELAKVVKETKSCDFESSINFFEEDCKLRNLRPHTLKYYLNELKVYERYLKEQELDTDPNSVTEETIKRNVILYMQEQGLKVVTINTRLRAIRTYFNFLHKQKYIKHNPVENIKLLKDRKSIVETFTADQLDKLLRQPDLRTFTGLRDYVIMLLLLETGVRANELVGIEVDDVRLREGSIYIKNAKTYRERVVPIQKKMRDTLEKWIAVRGVAECTSLFTTIDGTPLSKKQVQNRISYYGSKSGVTGVRISPHTFRHTFAKLSVKSGAGIFELQQILGHTSMEMVRTYVNLFSEDVKDKHKSFSPLKSISTRL